MDQPFSVFFYAMCAVVALIFLLRGMFQKEMRDILAYARMDEVDYLKALASKDHRFINEQIIESLCQQVNLRIFKLIRCMQKVESQDVTRARAIVLMIDKLETLRPSTDYEGGKLHTHISDFDFDYSIFHEMEPLQAQAIREIVKELITGFRYINTLIELNDRQDKMKLPVQGR